MATEKPGSGIEEFGGKGLWSFGTSSSAGVAILFSKYRSWILTDNLRDNRGHLVSVTITLPTQIRDYVNPIAMRQTTPETDKAVLRAAGGRVISGVIGTYSSWRGF